MNLHEFAVEKHRMNTFIPPDFVHLKPELMDPEVWGPHFWFFLHTIALHYPKYPNAVSKKKYYDFLSNLPLFIPVYSISVHFSKLLDEYPITPYLDNRDSLIKWMHFIHNKINESLEKPKISLSDFYINYYIGSIF